FTSKLKGSAMDADVKATIHEAAKASAEGRVSFAEVVGNLIAAGVERYHVDFVRGETTYYRSDDTDVLSLHVPLGKPAAEFSRTGVAAAVRGAQSGALKYPAFCRQALEAGCVGYIVSMVGRRVVYYGRTGDSHVEWFPGAR